MPTMRMLFLLAAVLAAGLWAEEPGLLKPVGGAGSGEAKDGLRVTLKPVKEDFGPGESLLMQATVANVGDAEKTLTVVKNRLQGGYDFRLELRRAGRDLAVAPRAEKDNPQRVERTLAPGAKLECWIDLRALAGDPKVFAELGGYEAAVVFAPTGARSGWAVFSVAEAGRPTPKPRDEAEAEKIRSLIQALGDDDFQKRENAEAELVAFGERALGLLKQAIEGGKDPEVKLRCKRVVNKIEEALKGRHEAGGLCEACRNKAFTADVGQCGTCHGGTPSGMWKHCRACAARQGVCPACGKRSEAEVLPRPIERPVRPRRPIQQPVEPPVPDPAPADDF
ncbi:MAG: hypothetical protein KIS92_16365 [Planctomycetota bacterium]|nr:hypothetical protein [Planctomycetota bacterium]